MNQRELELRLDNIERLVSEIHANVMIGGGAPLHTGAPRNIPGLSPEDKDAPFNPDHPLIRYIVRELMRGNKEPQKLLAGRKMVSSDT